MPVNYKNISTTNGREVIEKNLAHIDYALRDLPIQQRAIIEAQIIEESGGNPMAKSANDTYQGLLQWGKDRYTIKSKDPIKELDNQIQYLRQSLGAVTDGKSWTHGGKGSGYKTSKEAYGIFNNPDAAFDDSFRAFSYGYVRPYGKEASYNNRLKVGHQVYDRILQAETAPDTNLPPVIMQPDATMVVKPIVPIPTQEPIDLNLLHTKAEGGYLDTPWNELPISQRAEIMREAVNNGIYNLQDVRDAYHNNLFGGGGYMPSKAIKQRIAEWEGASMYKAAPDTGKVNRSFEAEAKDFNRVIPASIRAKLSQDQLDALYSYGYNVGMGNLKTRVLPTLTNYINGNAGAEDVVSSMWASRDSDPKMGGLRRRRAYERNQFIYGSPSEKRQSVVTSALNMDLSNLPSELSQEDLQQLYLANPTDYGTPVDYSTPTRPVEEAPIEEDNTQPSGMGIFNLMSNLGMFGSTKQDASIASYTPVKNSNPYVVSMPTNNSTLLDASWFADGGHLFNDGGDTITDAASGNVYYGVEDVVSPNQLVVNPDGSVTTVNGVTGAVNLPATTITGYRNTDDRIKVALGNIVKENPAQISSIPSIALTATGDLIKGGANAAVNAFGLPDVAPVSNPADIKDGDALLDYVSVVTPAAKANIFRPLTLSRNRKPHLFNFGKVEDSSFTFSGFSKNPLEMHKQRAIAKGYNPSEVKIYDISKDSPENMTMLKDLEAKYGEPVDQIKAELLDNLDTHGHAAALRNEKLIFHDGKLGDDLNIVLSHELDHALHMPKEALPKETFNPDLYIGSDYFTVDNGTEVAARGSQLHDYFGHTGLEPITEQELRYAKDHYVKDVGTDNDMNVLLQNIKDYKALADWMTKYSTGLAVPVTIGFNSRNQ